jgi:hypothetical protein
MLEADYFENRSGFAAGCCARGCRKPLTKNSGHHLKRGVSIRLWSGRCSRCGSRMPAWSRLESLPRPRVREHQSRVMCRSGAPPSVPIFYLIATSPSVSVCSCGNIFLPRTGRESEGLIRRPHCSARSTTAPNDNLGSASSGRSSVHHGDAQTASPQVGGRAMRRVDCVPSNT